MAPTSDHFTPLSRAVASMGRDDYAGRFAVYDREYNALLRRLAAAATPPSAADLAREEQAFRDAVRRVEFGDADTPTLVPRDEPIAAVEASAAQLRGLVAGATRANGAARADDAPSRDQPWPRRPPKREPATAVVPDEPVELLVERRRRRSVMRRVGERLVIAVVLLGFFGLAVLIGLRDDVAASAPPAPVAQTSPAQRSLDALAERMGLPKMHQPSWITPPMFYIPPPQLTPPREPVAPGSQAAAPLPRNEVPLPVPRPEI